MVATPPSIRWIRSLVLGCGLTLATAAVYLSWAAPPVRRLKIAEVVGQPIDNSVLVNSKPATVGVEVLSGQQIVTLQAARVGLQQADVLLGRLADQSAATVETDCVQLGDGQLVLSSTAGCVGAAIVRSNDAIYVLERLGTSGAVKVLAGQVEISVPSNASIPSLSLTSNQKVTLSLTGDEIGPVRLMLPAEVESLVQGELFQGFQISLQNQTTIAGLPKPIAPPPPKQPLPPPAKPIQPAKPPATPVATSNIHPAQAQRGDRTSDSTPSAHTDAPAYNPGRIKPASPPTYNRLSRRRPSEPNYAAYTPRRRWSRSPYAGNSYRRRPPSYAPSYAPQEHVAPATPEIAPTIEVPSPGELPPATSPVMPHPELPPPAIVEPPLTSPLP